MTDSYLEFTEAEAVRGVEYAKEHFLLSIPPEHLRDLANRIRQLMARKQYSFADARYLVLNDAKLFATTKKAQGKRKAYSSALAKMFSWRAAQAKRHKRARTQPKATAPSNHNGQLEWTF